MLPTNAGLLPLQNRRLLHVLLLLLPPMPPLLPPPLFMLLHQERCRALDCITPV